MNIKKKITSGLRCKTYIINEHGSDVLYQEYKENAYYQAKKKYDVIKKIECNAIKNCFIPNVYKYINFDDKSVLYSEVKDGLNLEAYKRLNKKFMFNSIAKDLAKTLYDIHSVKDNKYFGWITDDGCVGNTSSFKEYIVLELNRLEQSFKEYLNKDELIYIREKENEILEYLNNNDENIKPQLIWYDINPSNILIKDNKLSGLVDPGGAKYATKELDLAFIKMEVCKNEEEFSNLLNEYEKLDNTIDKELINKMCILVELDDLAIRVQDKIFLPIPYCTNFYNIINRVHKEIIK